MRSQKQETFGISALKSNGNVITDGLSKAEIFNSQFKSVFTPQSIRQIALGVGSWPSNRVTEGSNPKGTRLYFVILLKNVEKSLIGIDITV